MRAAVVAIRAGVFDDSGEVDVARACQAPSAAVAGVARRPGVGAIPWAGADTGGAVVLAVAGHAGAGASTVALAVAEGLAETRRVLLVDYAEPARSGLAVAAAIELGTDGNRWRRGRRGRLEVLRLARDPVDGELPPLPGTDDTDRAVVVDAGWSLTGALLAPPRSLVRGSTVVVTRLTVPAVRQTERVLAAIDGDAAVAAVGPARWPRPVEASCGPRLRELRSRGQVVPVPVDRRLQLAGLTGDPLPKSVAAAGRSLAALLVPAGPRQPRQLRAAQRSRTGPAGTSR
ncbi:hypothetical protein [Geodermatophilus obscurus]|nr:hypothetical protein [Geodermatophilus obscurus]